MSDFSNPGMGKMEAVILRFDDDDGSISLAFASLPGFLTKKLRPFGKAALDEMLCNKQHIINLNFN